MKKLIPISLFGIAAMLVGCNTQSPDIVNPAKETVQIKITINHGHQSRVDQIIPTADNYVIEVYTDDNYSTPAKVFDDQTTNKATSEDGNFSAIIDRSKDYYILCWADRKFGDNFAYTTSSPKAVTLAKTTEVAQEA